MKYGKMIGLCTLFCLLVGWHSVNFANETLAQLNNANPNEIDESMKNQKQGEVFLDANRTKPGVVTLPDGLQYKVLVKGKGAKPAATDTVTVHYAGRLINGKEFDSSYQRGEPVSFPLNGVIPGWTEALQLMNEGSTWELYIPASLAYGERGAPPVIGPNETLIFKVNLIKVNKS